MSAEAIFANRTPSRRRIAVRDQARRVAAFRSARLHTILVRTLRIGLPVACVAVLAGLAMNSRRAPSDGFDFSIANSTISPNGIVMDSPMLSGTDGNGREYRIMAARAIHRLNAPNEITVEEVEAEIISTNRGHVTVSAERGDYHRTAGALALTGLVHVKSADGYELRLNSAHFDINNGTMVSEQGVSIGLKDSVTVAERLSVRERGRIITLEGSVKTTLMPPNRPGSGGAAKDAGQ